MSAIEQVAGVSLITPDRLESLRKAVIATSHLTEDMAELGVYRGGSALVLSESAPEKVLHLFDTFSGLPQSESLRHNPMGLDLDEGRFAANESEARALLAGRDVSFHAGTFPKSATGLEWLRFSFVHIDCDLYYSAKAGIEWFWPRLVSGGIMFFDDYGCDFTGVTDAVHEAFRDSDIQKQEYANGIKIGCFVKKDQ